ncbi:MAG: hypothetical protein U1E65_06065 [Myxococcota bacterium]
MRSARLLGVVLAAWPGAARAEFDSARGKVDNSGAAIAIGFERGEVPALTLYGPSSGVPLPEGLFEHLRASPSEVIEGDRSLAFGGGVALAYLQLDSSALGDTRVELRLWQKPLGTRAVAMLQWPSGRLGFMAAQLSLQPTGRATDDGWEEWSTGPIDALLGASLPFSRLQLYDEQLWTWRQGLSSYDDQARVLIDGISVKVLGPPAVPAARCTLLSERSDCGDRGACLYGRCADAAVVVGPWLENPDLRRDYLARRSFEFSNFEGGRIPESHTAEAASIFDQMRTVSRRTEYWRLYTHAVELLGDGHAARAWASFPTALSYEACLYQAQADLLPDQGTHPMVFELPVSNQVTRQLSPGDVLTAIDGVPVDTWAAAAERLLSYGGDPAGRLTNITPQLIDAAAATGANLHFERCTATSSSANLPRPCRPDEVERYDIDLAQVEYPIWMDHADDDGPRRSSCDFRFRRPVEDSLPSRDYAYAGFRDDSGIRSIQINGVPDPNSNPAWATAIQRGLEDGPPRVLFDQRQGLGGTIQGVDWILGYLLDAADTWAAEFIPPIDSLTTALREGLRTCAETTDGSACGLFFRYLVGLDHPSRGVGARAKIAVLNAQDVSGNDYTSELFHRRQGPTRIFGPAPSFGAFGVIWQLPAYGGEAIGGAVQVHDTVFLSSPDDSSLDFRTTHGVVPDVIVLQTQSDAMRGVDTVLEAARDWLAQ